jgi:DNA-binding CsgD family transcriptional regulator
LGWAALLQSDSELARALHTEGLELQREVGDRPAASESLGALACVAQAQGEAGRAARLFGAAQALREVIGYQQESGDRALAEPYLAAARSRLGEAAWDVAYAEGREMTFEESVDYALSVEKHPTTPASAPAPGYPAGLTPREMQVLRMVAQGMASAEVAKELFVSTRTVDTHLTSIYHKLGISSRAAATRFALEHGLA